MSNDIEPQSAEVEIAPDDDGVQPVTRIPRKKKSVLHPWTAGLILGMDWLFFSGTFFSGASALVAVVPIGFVSALVGAAIIQRKLADDSREIAILKGVAAGLVVAVPLPIVGTVVGGMILGMAGLDNILGLITRAKHEDEKA